MPDSEQINSNEKRNGEERVGVYTCYCGGNISHVVDCEEVAKRLAQMPGVVVSRTDLSFCSDAGQAVIQQDIQELGINRVVIGACAPSLHEETFRGAVRRAGLNPFLYHHVGIREQVSWVHPDDHAGATEKASQLMAAGVAKALLLSPLEPIRLQAERHALVIGGGAAGLRAAVVIARQGIRVTLVEKAQSLGGRMADLGQVFPTGEQARSLLKEMIAQAESHPWITILTEAEVVGVSGYVGNYEVQVRQKEGGLIALDKVGAIVVATGFDPYQPRQGEYGYGDLAEVVTLPKFIQYLANNGEGKTLTWNGREVRDVAFIHCVGSREIDGVHEPQPDGQVNNYCSRVCCTATLHMIDHLQKHYPGLNIFDLHEDIRTYGRGHEDYYWRTLQSGTRFVRFQGTERPTVEAAPADARHPVMVNVHDLMTYNEEIQIPVDLVVLATGMMPRPVDDLVQMLKISRGNDRFLLEVHPKLRPVETAVNGIVLAGTAQGPMNIQESLAAAAAAAAKVATLLAQGQVELPPFVARVDAEKCSGSGACVLACVYEGAIALETRIADGREVQRAVVTPANCTGCGACVGACPNHAIDIQAWTLAQYEAMVDAIAADYEFAEAAL